MKLSTTFALTLAVATAGLTSFSTASQAANITLNGRDGSSITVDSTQDYVFEFVRSNGSFQSNFYVPPNSTPAITEAAPGFISTTPDFPGACSVCSFVSKVTLDYFVLETVAVDDGNADLRLSLPILDFSDPARNGGNIFAGAIFTGNSGDFTITFNDRFPSDVDMNDFVVTAKAVPVPAIVPGIALAGAFLGSKALKRKKNDASKTSA